MSAPVMRAYVASDAEATRNVFESAVRISAADQYDDEQRAVWIASAADAAKWATARVNARTCVAEIDGEVVGFTDIDATGYIDMLYVSASLARRGIGTALLQWAIDEARRDGIPLLTAHVSVTARPLFEHLGFRVNERRVLSIAGVQIVNYSMSRRATDAL